MKLKHVKTITKRVLRSSTFDQWTVSPHLLVGWAAPKIWQRLCSHTVPCRVTAATEAAWRRTPVGDSGAIVSSAIAMRQFREIWESSLISWYHEWSWIRSGNGSDMHTVHSDSALQIYEFIIQHAPKSSSPGWMGGVGSVRKAGCFLRARKCRVSLHIFCPQTLFQHDLSCWERVEPVEVDTATEMEKKCPSCKVEDSHGFRG